MKVTEHSALTSNLAYTFGAFSVFMYNASQAFRYRTTTDFYKIGKLGADSTNYWELSDQVRLYGATALGMLSTYDSDSFNDTVFDAAVGIWLTLWSADWMYAAWNASAPEDQMAMLEEARATIADNKVAWADKPMEKKEEAAEEAAEEGEEGAEEGAEEGE